MISVMEFAHALMDRAIEKSVTMSHLKLQKLAYYCQGLHLAVHNTPIFTEDFEAWRHGPVVDTIYHEYKRYGDTLIPHQPSEAFFDLTPENQEMVDFVLDSLGNLGCWELVHRTHTEAPWKDVYVPMSYGGASITKDSMKEYFDTVLTSRQDAQLASVMDNYLEVRELSKRVRLPNEVETEDDFLNWIKNF
ncbi:Panacea domain-containing protein [Alteromonas lipotrueae]|uniref:Panacea domain-containing protein n=1 Tax=Alteromonas lipotrueae TaxID=2803814 RepID=UPI001C44E714|nr:type II toxin-antitoxin system antitoxin SocA domain-containing protein [Alteromonas lipotrueae]